MTSLLLAEPARNKGFERIQNLFRLRSERLHGDRGAGRGSEHHQAHDRCPAHALAAARHPHLRIERLDRPHELRRGARMQALLIDDPDHPDQGGLGLRLVVRRIIALVGFAHAGDIKPCPSCFAQAGPAAAKPPLQTIREKRGSGVAAAGRSGAAYLPASTWLAMVTYLRPASCALATASVRQEQLRTLASLISIGRLMPASTSTFGLLMNEMARLDGVPPNMSVRIATPSPLSARLTAAMTSLRRCSTLSSGPIVTTSS